MDRVRTKLVSRLSLHENVCTHGLLVHNLRPSKRVDIEEDGTIRRPASG